ncbi:MAG: hypothetical protein J6Y33_03385 [Prevotella sp.]|nr:hypothetical protein [Prevotella sp.]
MRTIISNIHCNGKTVINGKVYENIHGSMTVTDEGIFIDGKPIEEYKEPPVVKIEITGNVDTKNGNVQVGGGVGGDVTTKNGNITGLAAKKGTDL